MYHIAIWSLLTSVILGIALCSMKTESWASTRTRPARNFSPCVPSVRPWCSLIEWLFPESNKNWSMSLLKKSWNPSWTQSMMKSLSFTSSPRLSSRSWRNSYDKQTGWEKEERYARDWIIKSHGLRGEVKFI